MKGAILNFSRTIRPLFRILLALVAVCESGVATAQTGVPTVGLRLWLEADAGITQDQNGNVSIWQDQSGLGNDAVQNSSSSQPTLAANSVNGMPTVYFDGNYRFFSLPDLMAGAAAGELFVVLRTEGDQNAPHGFMRFGSGGYSGGAGTDIFYPYLGRVLDAFGSTEVKDMGVPSVPLTEFHLYDATSLTGEWQARINGRLQYATPNNVVGFATDPTIGALYYSFQGNMAEILVYDRLLTDSERETVGVHLNNKYAFVPAPPPAPTEVKVEPLSPDQASVRWSGSSSNSSTVYTVERGVDQNSFAVVADLTDSTSYLDGGLTAGTTYMYRVSARNFAGSSSYSSSATVTTLSTGTSFPLGGIRLWLKGDAGVIHNENGQIRLWQDQSSQPANAVQVEPASEPDWIDSSANGRPTVYFDGNYRFFTLPDFMSAATAGELFVVLKTEGDPDAPHGFLRFGSGGDSSGPGTDIFYPYLGRILDAFGSTAVKDLGVPSLPLTEFHLYDATSLPGEWEARINGELQYTTPDNAVGFATDPTVGALYFAFQGNMAEILVYDHVLTESERETVGVYLNSKYAFVPAPPPTPTAVKVEPLSPAQTSLRWSGSPSNSSTVYTIERGLDENSFVFLADLTDSTSYIDGGLAAGTTYFYRVRARNFAGSSSYSSTATVTTLSTGASFPLEDIRLWLKGDAGVIHNQNGQIRLWQDQSSQQTNAVQLDPGAEPEWIDSSANGRPTIYFDGNYRFFSLPDFMSAATAGELFVVLKTEGDPNVPHGFMRFGSGGDSSGPGTDIFYPYLGRILDAFGSTAVKDLGVLSQPITEFHLYNSSSKAGEWTARLNGNLQYTTLDNVAGFATDPTIGALYYSFQGNVAEILVYDRVLTSLERERVQWYLADKYLIGRYDLDNDGLNNAQEEAIGTDPYNWDTNGDFVPDGAEYYSGFDPISNDVDGDGLTNAYEYSIGTNAFAADSDGDGVADGQDAYPLDPTRSQAPAGDPNDHTAPGITLTEPVGAVLLP